MSGKHVALLSHSEAITRIAELEAEIERLAAVLRQTCVNECGPEYRDRDLHAPGCLAYEVEP